MSSQDIPTEDDASFVTAASPSDHKKDLSGSVTREPIRSFIHGSVRDHLTPLDSAQYARSVREDTAELANYLLSDHSSGQSPAFLNRTHRPSVSSHVTRDEEDDDEEEDTSVTPTPSIPEVSEPSSLETVIGINDGPSIIASMLRRSPSQSDRGTDGGQGGEDDDEAIESSEEEEEEEAGEHENPVAEEHGKPAPAERFDPHTETTPLLRHQRTNSSGRQNNRPDLESQKPRKRKTWTRGVKKSLAHTKSRIVKKAHKTVSAIRDPKTWQPKNIYHNAILPPVTCLPAVIVGLLLNILDALSYGMILFPLGSPIFASLGSAGISIFYVSTIVSQLTFSSGSIFRGGVGSELIEVVPFFHSMAGTITDLVGEDKPEAVIATTITSYALSAMLTGTVFYCMGRFKFGYIVGFIPRHILIGCIGGVGWFLVATGFEVTARMEGSLEYDLDTLHRLLRGDTVPLWSIPLALAIVLFYAQTKNAGKYFLPLYIIAIPIVFYFFVLSLNTLDTDNLRDNGWIFEGPPPGEPWWYFYTLYQFDKVHWGAIFQCIPAMLALTFFGILHVPINVPALAMNSGEDHVDLDYELKLHGYSNFLSGCCGSIQNYLVYANTLFFMRSGGDSRLAGYELAALTFCVMIIGPSLIGFIPVMMVGVLIFDLGFELLLEAVWSPRKKLTRLEHLTVMVIVLVMGIYDFVVGIGVGILLAFIALIFQASRVSAVRASYSGDVVGSTVRRNPSQQHYLRQVGRQIYVMKLAGFLFFGTIHSVEGKIRHLISDEAFNKRPIKYLVLDMTLVTGLDYSAGEAFNTISRLLHGRGILLVLSGVDAESELGRNLRAVGLGEDGIEVMMLPDLNSALEFCENELLKIFYASQEARHASRSTPATHSLDVPLSGSSRRKSSSSSPSRNQNHHYDHLIASSPRRSHLQEAARQSLNHMESLSPANSNTAATAAPRYQNFSEPLRLILQIFSSLSSPDKNEDFWFRAVPFFARQTHAPGTVLFRRGEPATGFYLVESGLLRAEYDLPQGWLCESIVAGTTCGELPFFSETARTATAVVEREAIVWIMDCDGWTKCQEKEPEVARELLKISLKLTSERMSAITGFVLSMAG